MIWLKFQSGEDRRFWLGWLMEVAIWRETGETSWTHPPTHTPFISLFPSHALKSYFFSLSPSQAFTLGLGTFLCFIRIRGGIEAIMLRSICARDRELCFWSLSDQGLTSYSSVWVRAGRKTVNAQARTSPNDCVRLWRILYLYALHVITTVWGL